VKKEVIYNGVNSKYGFTVTVTKSYTYVGEGFRRLVYTLHVGDRKIASFENENEAFIAYMEMIKV